MNRTLQRTLPALLLSFVFASTAAAQNFPTYGEKVSSAARMDPADPIRPGSAFENEAYVGQLKPNVRTVTVGCNPRADGKDCQSNPATGRMERTAVAVCNRLAVFQGNVTLTSGKKQSLALTKPSISFFNFLMFPRTVVESGANNFTGVFGDMSVQPSSTARFRQHLMNGPDVITVDLGGPGHSMSAADISNAQRVCADAHNAAP